MSRLNKAMRKLVFQFSALFDFLKHENLNQVNDPARSSFQKTNKIHKITFLYNFHIYLCKIIQIIQNLRV